MRERIKLWMCEWLGIDRIRDHANEAHCRLDAMSNRLSAHQMAGIEDVNRIEDELARKANKRPHRKGAQDE
jgi:hypothetical protein